MEEDSKEKVTEVPAVPAEKAESTSSPPVVTTAPPPEAKNVLVPVASLNELSFLKKVFEAAGKNARNLPGLAVIQRCFQDGERKDLGRAKRAAARPRPHRDYAPPPVFPLSAVPWYGITPFQMTQLQQLQQRMGGAALARNHPHGHFPAAAPPAQRPPPHARPPKPPAGYTLQQQQPPQARRRPATKSFTQEQQPRLSPTAFPSTLSPVPLLPTFPASPLGFPHSVPMPTLPPLATSIASPTPLPSAVAVGGLFGLDSSSLIGSVGSRDSQQYLQAQFAQNYLQGAVQSYAQAYAQQYAQQCTQLLAQQYAAGISAVVAAQQHHQPRAAGLPFSRLSQLPPPPAPPASSVPFFPGTHTYSPTGPPQPRAGSQPGAGVGNKGAGLGQVPPSSAVAAAAFGGPGLPSAGGQSRPSGEPSGSSTSPSSNVLATLASQIAQRTPGTTFHFNLAANPTS